jgi:hypothetical protein
MACHRRGAGEQHDSLARRVGLYRPVLSLVGGARVNRKRAVARLVRGGFGSRGLADPCALIPDSWHAQRYGVKRLSACGGCLGDHRR